MNATHSVSCICTLLTLFILTTTKLTLDAIIIMWSFLFPFQRNHTTDSGSVSQIKIIFSLYLDIRWLWTMRLNNIVCWFTINTHCKGSGCEFIISTMLSIWINKQQQFFSLILWNANVNANQVLIQLEIKKLFIHSLIREKICVQRVEKK